MIDRTLTRIMLSFVAVFVVAFSVAGVAIAQTDSLSDEMLDTIRARCSNSQFALQQIEKRDAVSRINRGRAYDQMLRQLSAFNSRFAYNKISSPDLLQYTTELQDAVNAFRSSYDRYDTDIANALKVNCKEKPSDYYAVIVKSREDRNTVGAQVRKIEELIGKYREAIVKYGEDLK
ncbi:MAG TPA: hypothetical protein VJM46_03860 [Candidatus Saccharimonadales bacterium]|nr:hypothetical protein [Candidatus Saccharimonadales bacterium]